MQLILDRGRRCLLTWSLLGCCTIGLCADEPLLERGAAGWRYLEAPATKPEQCEEDRWTAVDFDDSSWPEGKAMLGYGDQDIVTELSFGSHPQRKESSALFRRRFRVARGRRFRLLRGRLCCDDGAIVFVNGREVFRCNLPSGRVTYATRAVRAIGPNAADERRYHQFAVSSDAIVEGKNVVAVSVHQANATSSDLAMDLELTGLTSDQAVAEFENELKQQSDHEVQSIEGSMQIGPVVRFHIDRD